MSYEVHYSLSYLSPDNPKRSCKRALGFFLIKHQWGLPYGGRNYFLGFEGEMTNPSKLSEKELKEECRVRIGKLSR